MTTRPERAGLRLPLRVAMQGESWKIYDAADQLVAECWPAVDASEAATASALVDAVNGGNARLRELVKAAEAVFTNDGVSPQAWWSGAWDELRDAIASAKEAMR
jgi:hypothetical protein